MQSAVPRQWGMTSGESCGDTARACRVLFKQRDNRFYPPSAWSLALLLVRIPFQLLEAVLYSCVVYFWVGGLLRLSHTATLRKPLS